MGLRPYLSDSGPQKMELMLRKTKKTINERFTSGSEHFSCSLMVGSAGKYRSVDNGGKEAVDATRTMIIPSESCFGCLRFVSRIAGSLFSIMKAPLQT